MHACMHDRILCILSACGATATSLHRATAAQHPGVDLREMPAGAPRACTRCGRFVNGRPVHGGPAAKLLRALFQAALQAWQRAHAAPAPGAQRAAPAQAARPHPAFLLFIACPPGLYDAAFDPGKTMERIRRLGPRASGRARSRVPRVAHVPAAGAGAGGGPGRWCGSASCAARSRAVCARGAGTAGRCGAPCSRGTPQLIRGLALWRAAGCGRRHVACGRSGRPRIRPNSAARRRQR